MHKHFGNSAKTSSFTSEKLPHECKSPHAAVIYFDINVSFLSVPALPIVLRLSSEDVAAARAVLRPRGEGGALRCPEVLEVPALTCRARPVGRVGTDAVCVVRRLTVGHDARDVDREPEPVGECRHRHRQPLDLRGGRRLRTEILRRRSDAAEEGDADTPTVAQVRRGVQRIECAVPDHIDRAVRVDLDVVVREELPVVPRRPVQVELSLLFVTRDIQQCKKISPRAEAPGR